MTSIRKAHALFFALVLLASVPALAQAPNVTGEWAFNVTTDQGGGTQEVHDIGGFFSEAGLDCSGPTSPAASIASTARRARE